MERKPPLRGQSGKVKAIGRGVPHEKAVTRLRRYLETVELSLKLTNGNAGNWRFMHSLFAVFGRQKR